ncbi:MAG: M12 family metallo-peptidase [Phycisphaerae bacterium]
MRIAPMVVNATVLLVLSHGGFLLYADEPQGISRLAGKVTAYDVVALTMEAEEDRLTVRVPLDGAMHALDLTRHSLRSNEFRVMVPGADGGFDNVAIPAVTTYRGVIADMPEKEVAASVIEGKLHAMIFDPIGDSLIIEPLHVQEENSNADLYAAYVARDLIAGAALCGSDDLAGQQDGSTRSDPAGELRGAPGPVAGQTDIAFDADYEFYQHNGNSIAAVVADIEMILNQVDMVYSTQVGICYQNTGVIVRDNAADPYTSTVPNTLLCEFGDEWNANVSLPRDVAHLMTGKELDGITVGVAWNGVVCAGNFTNCNGGGLDYGLSESDYNYPDMTPLVGRVGVTSHELGHNWNACHCDQSSCTGGPGDVNCGIMNSLLNGSLLFNSRSVAAITAHRDSRNCLDVCATDGLPGDMNCDGTVSVSDIGGFVLALTDPSGYAAQYPDCDIENGDINQDSSVSVSDIGPFVALLTGG